MAYEYDEFIDAIRFGLTMSDRDTTDDIWKMVDEYLLGMFRIMLSGLKTQLNKK